MASKKFLLNKNIKMIVCDMAGTTVNEGGIVYRTLHDTIKNFGLKIGEHDIEKWHGINKYEVLDHFLNKSFSNKDNIDYNRTLLYKQFNNNLIDSYSQKGNLNLIHEDLPEHFNKLRENGIKVCLNTGYSKHIQESIIDSLNMRDFIDDYISSEDVLVGRPYPYMIHALMERNNITTARHVIKLGDTANDITEGFNAQCHTTIGVLSGADDESVLWEAGCIHLLNSVMDLELEID